MIDHKENLKLIDFGIARLFKAGKNSDTIYLGTPGYAPPEQYGKSQTDARSDIYSLGATLHYLTTGRDPGTSPFSFSPVRNFNPHISEALENLIMKAVKFKPHERWQNIIEMKQVLSSLRTQVETAGIKVPQEPSTSIYKTETPNPLVVSLSGLCDYQTISEAIKVAKAGTIIYVHSGIYREGLILDRAVEIIGEGKEGEIIIESENSSCILMETEEASIRNLTLRCTAGIKKYYGVDIPRGRLVIEDCDIRSDSLACIGIHGAKAAPVIRKCKIHDGERGIVFSKEGKGNIEECEIFCNKKENIKITEKSDPFIKQSKIYKGKNGGIIITTKGLGTFEECEIYDNTLSGIIISREGNPIIKRCKIYNGSRGILVSENGAGLLEECHIFNNTKSGVEILDRGNPTLSHCRIYDGNLQGIYIYKKGEGTIKNCELSGNKGAGIEITSEGNPIIKNCKIFNGKSYGIYIWLKGAGTFEECEIFGNVLPGMEIGENCNPTVKNCTIN
ncbi:MAG: Serine/threonine-protein kinase PknB [bacterium ADurb.Bin363]|nr:MAG: Serine/threonine-protein kinase PknB [bacterium ADurb.Bin363]